MDDNKISDVDSKVVNQIITELEKKFGKMTVKRGKEHTFVGMSITFIGNGKVRLTMKSYLEEAIQAFGEDVSVGAATPANRNLFIVNEDLPMLEGRQAESFHHIVAKLLYVAKRARIDLQLAIAFLCTRVSKSTQEDWEKLRRVLKYIHNTIDLRLVSRRRRDLFIASTLARIGCVLVGIRLGEDDGILLGYL